MTRIGTRALRVVGMAALTIVMATAVTAIDPHGAAAAGASMGWKNPMCDATVAPRVLYIGAPTVTAYDDTAGTDVNNIRYWTRLYDAQTGTPITTWYFAGEARATDVTPAAFPVAGTRFNQAYSVHYSIPNTTPNVRVQFSIAWYRTDWSLRQTSSPSVVTYRLAQISTTYVYGTGWVSQTGFTNAGSC